MVVILTPIVLMVVGIPGYIYIYCPTWFERHARVVKTGRASFTCCDFFWEWLLSSGVFFCFFLLGITWCFSNVGRYQRIGQQWKQMSFSATVSYFHVLYAKSIKHCIIWVLAPVVSMSKRVFQLLRYLYIYIQILHKGLSRMIFLSISCRIHGTILYMPACIPYSCR